jgi:hypothetical protein
MFCCHCGKPVEGGRFCTACGKPVAPDAVEAMRAEVSRHRLEMRLAASALGLILVIGAGLTVSWLRRAGRTADRPPAVGENSPRALPEQPPVAQAPPAEAVTPMAKAYAPQPQPAPQVAVPSSPASHPSAGGIDKKEVEKALAAMAPPAKQSAPSARQETPSAAPAGDSQGSDRYPGSQPVEVKDAGLPDIGVPVAGEVYSTSDSVPTVVSYYTQHYPDAQVMDISGQKVIAVSRPGMTKVIAIGTTGEETRIAIVQPR